jgi:1-acyl-sn-glycerol-3-phosphate acyltransferase
VADKDNKIKIYKGTNVLFEDNLITRPIAVEVFYENNKKPLIPIIAVAADDKLMLYLKYRQYYLYIFPPIPVDQEEQEIWRKMQSQEITTEQGVEQLNTLRDNGKGM